MNQVNVIDSKKHPNVIKSLLIALNHELNLIKEMDAGKRFSVFVTRLQDSKSLYVEYEDNIPRRVSVTLRNLHLIKDSSKIELEFKGMSKRNVGKLQSQIATIQKKY